jgi:prepilin-type N-terminal cleavage/methylation domain-containing protein
VKRLQRARLEGDRGFSLVELLVVIMLVGVVSTIAMNAVISGMRTTEKGNGRVAALADLQKGVERISREVRVASPIVAATASELTVTVYRGGAKRDYTYTYGGGNLTETVVRYESEAADAAVVGESESVLVDDVVTVAAPFQYFDDGGTELDPATLDVDDIHRVTVTISRSARRSQEPMSVTTDVFLRNER